MSNLEPEQVKQAESAPSSPENAPESPEKKEESALYYTKWQQRMMKKGYVVTPKVKKPAKQNAMEWIATLVGALLLVLLLKAFVGSPVVVDGNSMYPTLHNGEIMMMSKLHYGTSYFFNQPIVLGSQIAFQSAYCGFDVTIWLRSESSIGRTQPKLDHLHQVYIDTINLMATPDGQTPANWANGIADFYGFDTKKCLAKVEAAYKNTHLELDMAKAVADADLVIESMAENVEDKISFYQKLAPLMPAKTVLVTNSSTLLPSKFAKYTGRPDEYLSLHFANSIWKNNIAEIMAQSKTDPKVFDTVMQFAHDIRMIALPVRKEKSGYLLNSMLVPLLFSAMDLYVNGISDPESIDKAWTLGTGAPKGPFHILDTVGLTTAHNIVKMYLKIPSFLAPYNFKGMDKMLKEYIDAGKLGQSSGEGFFKYE